jgi:hypothetical protein
VLAAYLPARGLLGTAPLPCRVLVAALASDWCLASLFAASYRPAERSPRPGGE